MDEQDQEQDLRQLVRERLNSIALTEDIALDTSAGIRRLEDTLSGVSRHEKGQVRRRFERGRVSRREFLKLLGITGLGAVAAAGVTPVLKQTFGTTSPTGYQAASEDTETVEISAGETRVYNLGDGEEIRNMLFDCSADGAAVRIKASGSDWLIENIGVRGQWGNKKASFITPRVDDGGTGTIRRVYVKSYHDNGLGMWMPRSHAGELVVEGAYVEGFPNNATYFSSAGKGSSPGMGSITYRNCYFLNNSPANFRTGSPDCRMENCVSAFDGKTPEDYPLTSAGVNIRGLWHRGWDMTIVDSDMYIPTQHDGAGHAILCTQVDSTHPQADEAVVYLEDTRVTGTTHTNENGRIEGSSAGEAENRVPDGVPQTPEAAACLE